MMPFTLEVPKHLFKIVHTFDPKDCAPGVWAGCEGLKFEITSIDLQTGTITLELQGAKDDSTKNPNNQ